MGMSAIALFSHFFHPLTFPQSLYTKSGKVSKFLTGQKKLQHKLIEIDEQNGPAVAGPFCEEISLYISVPTLKSPFLHFT